MKWIKGLLLAAAVVLVLGACQSGSGENASPYQKADKVMEKWLKAFVKVDNDGMNELLVKKVDYLKDKKDKYPNAAKKMGDRYTIKRFNPDNKKNILYYRLTFYDPYPGWKRTMDYKLKKVEGKWKVTNYSGTNDKFEETYGGKNSTIEAEQWKVIHKWEG